MVWIRLVWIGLLFERAMGSFMMFMTFDVYGDGNSYAGIREEEAMGKRGSCRETWRYGGSGL